MPGNGAHWIIVGFALANDAGYVVGILSVSSTGPGLNEASFAGVASQLSIGLTEATVVCFLTFPLVMLSPLMYMFEVRIDPDNVTSAFNVKSVQFRETGCVKFVSPDHVHCCT